MSRPEDKLILVVDDEEDVRIYLRRLLKDAGFNVVTAADGEEAMERVKEHKPDFISLDLVMPKKSGVIFFHELRRNKAWSKIPVAFVTGRAKKDAVKQDLEKIFEGKIISAPTVYLEKPVMPADYANIVKRELGIEVTEELPQNKQELRRQLQELAESADDEALQEALKILKGKKE